MLLIYVQAVRIQYHLKIMLVLVERLGKSGFILVLSTLKARHTVTVFPFEHMKRNLSWYLSLVPIIGPSIIPRRDQRKTYVRSCRLMLIFFKPWRHAFDLRSIGQKSRWEGCFRIILYGKLPSQC